MTECRIVIIAAIITHAGAGRRVARAICGCHFVAAGLSVHATKGKRLELSTPKSVEI